MKKSAKATGSTIGLAKKSAAVTKITVQRAIMTRIELMELRVLM
jgi:hypothetical protein